MNRTAAAALALVLLACETAAAMTPVTAGRSESPVRLADVLAAVETHYPLLLALEDDRRRAAAGVMEARGGFDTRLVGDGDLRPEGFYENYSGGAGLEQVTRLWGTRLFAGYRIGRGDYPSYEGDRMTDGSGEVRGGFAVPLLRGGPIDDERARLRRAELGVEQFGPEFDLQRIDLTRDASIAYWRWVEAGLVVEVEQRLLEVAVARQRKIEGRVARGALPRVDATDNERLIVERRIRLRTAERDARQRAIQLSLFLRDGDGEPVVPGREQLPEDFPEETTPSPDRIDEDLARAASEHPRLRALAVEMERVRLDLELARNAGLPALDLSLQVSQDFGEPSPGISSTGTISPDPRGETEVKALVRFELPVLRREARGKAARARALLSRLGHEQRFLRDGIAAEIRRAMVDVETAHALALEARRNLELARELQRAEERKFALGDSNLIDVNIREIQTASAARELVETRAAYFRALATYEAARGVP